MADDNRNNIATTGTDATSGNEQPMNYDQLVRKVTERVWKLLREDLRKERERRGKAGRRL